MVSKSRGVFLPIVRDGSTWYYIIGKFKPTRYGDTADYCLFGGTYDTKDYSLVKTAERELYEETSGKFSVRMFSDVESHTATFSHGSVYYKCLLSIGFFNGNIEEARDKVRKFTPNREISEIFLFTADELLNIISQGNFYIIDYLTIEQVHHHFKILKSAEENYLLAKADEIQDKIASSTKNFEEFIMKSVEKLNEISKTVENIYQEVEPDLAKRYDDLKLLGNRYLSLIGSGRMSYKEAENKFLEDYNLTRTQQAVNNLIEILNSEFPNVNQYTHSYDSLKEELMDIMDKLNEIEKNKLLTNSPDFGPVIEYIDNLEKWASTNREETIEREDNLRNDIIELIGVLSGTKQIKDEIENILDSFKRLMKSINKKDKKKRTGK